MFQYLMLHFLNLHYLSFHYLLLNYLMLRDINVALFYVAPLMLHYFNVVLLNIVLF